MHDKFLAEIGNPQRKDSRGFQESEGLYIINFVVEAIS